jgi:hypothetical protein
MIKFEGEEFGPYKSKREAMLFAIDAAQKLGQQDEPTEVLVSRQLGLFAAPSSHCCHPQQSPSVIP